MLALSQKWTKKKKKPRDFVGLGTAAVSYCQVSFWTERARVQTREKKKNKKNLSVTDTLRQRSDREKI